MNREPRTLLLNTPEDLHEPSYNNHVLQPYGLAIISGFLKQKGCDVGLYDSCAYSTRRSDLVRHILRMKPDILGVTMMTHQVTQLADLIRDVKRSLPNLIAVAGGAHPTAEYESLLRTHHEFDIAVVGEGEITMLEIIDALKNNESFGHIDGAAFRSNGHTQVNPMRKPIEDLDSLPFADWESLPMGNYWCGWLIKKNYASINFSRGCPFTCTFCAHGMALGKSHRRRSPRHIAEELKWLYDRFGVRQLRVEDSTLINNEWIQEICEEMLRLNRPMIWGGNIRASTIDGETLKFMKRAGLVRLNLGIESADNGMLQRMKKGQTIEQVEEAVRLIDSLGIVSCYTFILGMPGETEKSLMKTMTFAKKLKRCFCTFQLATPFPGTELHDTAKDEGFLGDDWDNYDYYKVAYVPKGLTREKLVYFYKRCLFLSILRPSFLIWQITLSESWLNLLIRIKMGFIVLKRFLKARDSV